MDVEGMFEAGCLNRCFIAFYFRLCHYVYLDSAQESMKMKMSDPFTA